MRENCDAVIFNGKAATRRALLDAVHAAGSGKLFCWNICDDDLLIYGCSGANILGSIELETEDASLVVRALLSHSTQPIRLYESTTLLRALRRCGSPAEVRLLIPLCDALESNAGWDVVAQQQIGTHRVDFAVSNPSWEIDSVSPVRIVVEVDGHEWHERTKEQASRDKKRDRDIQADGWRVLRFTGSEVWKDPVACAQEVYELAQRLEG
jgi:very-short-patch-repair endonuclease